MTVTTIFGDTADGYINSSASGGYSFARAGTGTLTVDTTSTTFLVGQNDTGGKVPADECYEGFVSFDTSSITDSDTVNSVTLSCWLTTDNSTTDFTINARQFDWGATLTSADYVAGASLSGNTLMASISTSGIGSTGAYKDFTSQAAFLTATNLKTGTVHLVLDSSREEANNDPAAGTNEHVILASANDSGTTHDPKLAIDSTAATMGIPPFPPTTTRVWRVW